MPDPDQCEKIASLVAPLARTLGLALWGVEIAGGAGHPLVRIYADVQHCSEPETSAVSHLPHALTIDQCAELSRLVGLSLDVEDMFPAGWTLEVSSPGLERPFFSLEQLRNYISREIEVSLITPPADWAPRKNFCGILDSIDDDSFILSLPLLPVARRKADEPAFVHIPWNIVRRAKLVFSDWQKSR